MDKMHFVLIFTTFVIFYVQATPGKLKNDGCEERSFRCAGTDLCLPQQHWCDDEVHCPERDDELDCEDDLADEVINQKHRKRPGAEHDETVDVNPQACHFPLRVELSEVNETITIAPIANFSLCQCKATSVYCRHQQLIEAPPINKLMSYRFGQIDLFDLAGNNFPIVSATTFANVEELPMRRLVLQHCSVKELMGNCFEEILRNGLQELHLDGNRLQIIHAGAFDVENNKLQLLSIGHNRIARIEAGAFRRLERLNELDLSHNQLEKLHGDVFSNLYQLTILNLHGNQLKQIDAGFWPERTNASWALLLQQERRSIELPLDLHFKDYQDELVVVNTQFTIALDEAAQEENYKDKEEEEWRRGLEKLLVLSLGSNQIDHIHDACFADASFAATLTNLDLSDNLLETISNGTFQGLRNLRVLALQENNLQLINEQALSWMPNLTSLNLQNNENLMVSTRTFGGVLLLRYLYFDHFEFCAHAPHVQFCEPKGDGISSKENLLDSVVLRISVYIMAFIGFVGNTIVLLGRQFITRHTTNIIDSLHIKNLAVSDLLMSIYLFIIAGVDESFRGDYLTHEWKWRHSSLCTVSGILNTLSCESSVLILSLVTWDRFVSVTRPFPRNQLSFRYVALRLAAIWILALIVAVLPTANFTHCYFAFEFYNSNGVCLPLYLHNPYAKGWHYSVAMFVFVNLSALLFIGYAYWRMIKAIRISTVACRSTQQTQDRDRVAQHLGIIVFTDCLCWVPIILIKMATLAGLQLETSYKNFVYASLAIYIMPINSALNPILYTFATPLFKKQLLKVLRMCCRRHGEGHAARGDGHSGYDTAMSLSLGVLGSNRRFLTYRGTQTSHTGGSKNSWKKQPAAV